MCPAGLPACQVSTYHGRFAYLSKVGWAPRPEQEHSKPAGSRDLLDGEGNGVVSLSFLVNKREATRKLETTVGTRA